MAVVDPSLRVHGLEALRIVDASIMPVIPGANTMAASIMIGEKGADLVRGRTLPPEHPLEKAPRRRANAAARERPLAFAGAPVKTADVRILEIKTMPGHLLRRAHQVSTAIFTEALAEQDITSVQYVALAALSEFADLDATRLAEMIAFDRATIGDVIERLERKGLLERERSRTDGRAKTLKITPAGRALLNASHAAVMRVQDELLQPLSPAEQTLFCQLLARVARETD